mgnify:CR=1 FL=1
MDDKKDIMDAQDKDGDSSVEFEFCEESGIVFESNIGTAEEIIFAEDEPSVEALAAFSTEDNLYGFEFKVMCSRVHNELVFMTLRVHPFPFRTR